MQSWPSLTAEAVCMARALEHRRSDRLVDDPHASGFLRLPARAVVRLAARAGPAADLAEWGLDPGLVAAIGARHGWIDARAASALEPGSQLLVLGAGYDSRAWRLPVAEVHCVELDHPATARRKARCVQRVGLDPNAREVLTADLMEESLEHALGRSSLDPARPTVVIWEGVTMYLDEATVGRTLAILREHVSTRTSLLLDVWSAARNAWPLEVAEQAGRVGLAGLGEPLRFSCLPVEVPAFFDRHGWTVIRHTDVDAHARSHAGRRAFPRLQLVQARPA